MGDEKVNIKSEEKLKKDEKPKKKDKLKDPNKIKLKSLNRQNPEVRYCTFCKKKIDPDWNWKNLCSYDCMDELAELEYSNFMDGKGVEDKKSKSAQDIHLYLE